MSSRLSTFVQLGPLHGPLAVVSRMSGSTSVEKSLLQSMKRPYVRSRYGVTMKSNWSDATFNMCYFGSYGKTLSDLLRQADHPFIFLDIGANQGLYSLIAGTNRHCRAAIAFEPVPATFSLLEANVAANDLNNVVLPVNRAISAEAGKTVIRMSSNHSGGASMAATNAVEGDDIIIHTIDHREMDDLIPDGPEAILIKIDVEGFEPVVVNELAQSRHIDRMMMLFYEIDEQWVDPAAIERTLREIGFSTFRKVNPGSSSSHYDVLATR